MGLLFALFLKLSELFSDALLFGDFFLCLLHLLGKCLLFLALEKPCGVFQLLFQLR